jgi:hypothetical protein
MSFNVRITGYRGIVQSPVLIPGQDSKDSVYLMNQPYEFSQVAVSNGATPVPMGPSGLPTSTDYSKVLRVEVPAGSAIRYEANPPNRSVAASNISPNLIGVQNIMWGPGWTLSFVDAASFP